MVREAIQEGKTRKANTKNRKLKASLNRVVGENSFSEKVLRILRTEKTLFLEAKIPKKKPLIIYKRELTIWLKLSMAMLPKDKIMLQL